MHISKCIAYSLNVRSHYISWANQTRYKLNKINHIFKLCKVNIVLKRITLS